MHQISHYVKRSSTLYMNFRKIDWHFYCFGGYHIGHFHFILTLGLKLCEENSKRKNISQKRIFKRILSFYSFLLSVWKGPDEIHMVIIIFLNFWGYPEYVSNLLIIDNCSLLSLFLRDQLTNMSRRFCTENDTGLVLLWLAVTLEVLTTHQYTYTHFVFTCKAEVIFYRKTNPTCISQGFNTLTLTKKLFDQFPIGLFIFLYPIKTVLREILSVSLNINHERPSVLHKKNHL